MALSPETAADQPTSRSWLGWPLALTATFSFSIAPAVSRGAIIGGLRPEELLVARMILSLGLMGGFMALFTPGRLRIDRRGFFIAVGTGLINGLGFLAFFSALTRLEASIASMIFSLNTLVVVGFLALRGERITRRHAFRLILGLSGVYLLIGPSGSVDLIGALLVMVAVFTFAIHLVSIQWYLRTYQAWTITFYVIAGITFVSVVWWLLTGAGWHEPGRDGWLAILTLTLVSTFLARLVMFGGVKYLGSGQIALTVPLETLMSVTWSLLFLHERLSAWQYFGGVLILASMVLAIQRLRIVRRPMRWRVSSHW